MCYNEWLNTGNKALARQPQEFFLIRHILRRGEDVTLLLSKMIKEYTIIKSSKYKDKITPKFHLWRVVVEFTYVCDTRVELIQNTSGK